MLRSMLKNSIVTMQTMDFAKKTKKSKTSDGLSEYETAEDVAEPEVVFQAPTPTRTATDPTRDVNEKPWLRQTQVLNLDKALFAPFSLGDVKVVTSTPDHKAPSYEDTIEGRYANVLFTTASGKGALYEVYEDMMYLSELYKHSEVFRQFTENAGVGNKEISELNTVLRETAEFNPITHHFLTILAENKRLIFIKDIAGKYQKLYQQFNKEEKITIISAETLTSVQQS
jgi:F0F1-type ATP synthase delta subunit